MGLNSYTNRYPCKNVGLSFFSNYHIHTLTEGGKLGLHIYLFIITCINLSFFHLPRPRQTLIPCLISCFMDPGEGQQMIFRVHNISFRPISLKRQYKMYTITHLATSTLCLKIEGWGHFALKYFSKSTKPKVTLLYCNILTPFMFATTPL